MSDIYGSYQSSSADRKWRAWLNYTITTTNTQVTFSANCKMDLSGGSGTTAKFQKNGAKGKLYVGGSNVASYTNSSGAVTVNAANDWQMTTYSATYNRGTTATSKIAYWTITTASGSWAGTSTTGNVTISIPALPSYAVSYNNNGGSGTIANQTKWYGTDLTLSDGTGFTRTGYTLTGWNTAADGTGTHYSLGQTYTGNAALTLYAEWTLNAVIVFTKVSSAIKQGIFYVKMSGNIYTPHTGYTKVNGTWKQIT